MKLIRPLALVVAVLLVGALPACAWERRGIAWQIGAGIGPAVQPGATLSAPLLGAGGYGCCGGAPAPALTLAAPCQPATVSVPVSLGCSGTPAPYALPMAVQQAPVSYGCCGGGGGLYLAYSAPPPQQVYQAVYQTPPPAALPMAPPSCPSQATALYVQHMQSINSCFGSASGSVFAQQAQAAPMSNQELTEHLLELSSLLDRMAGVLAEHDKALKRAAAPRPAKEPAAGGP